MITLISLIMSESTKKSNLEKRKPKGPVKFNITLNDEQKRAKSVIMNHPVTLLMGEAGSGKTLVACQVALDMLFNREIEQIIICRPAVSTESIGFLPGSADDKLLPYLQPILNNFQTLYNKDHIEKLISNGTIQIIPFAFMRGHTFTNACIIVDEAQNLEFKNSEMVLGRLGLGSKMIICGDTAQIDLESKKRSGIFFLAKLTDKLPDDIGEFQLKLNHRHPSVPKILAACREYEAGGTE